MKINELFKEQLVFEEDEFDSTIFLSNYKGEIVKVRMNDFPDEVMYTIFYLKEVLDEDDLPDNWVLNYK